MDQQILSGSSLNTFPESIRLDMRMFRTAELLRSLRETGIDPGRYLAFWDQVDLGDEAIMDGCWLWTGFRSKWGYGQFGRNLKAHRVSLAWALGRSLTPDEVVAHQCDNPPCIRPSHLFITSQSGNTSDMWDKGRARPRGLSARGRR